MYMLMNEYRDIVTFSNEPIGENVFYPDAGLEWTEEALEKMPEWARKNFENGLRDLYSEECGYGDCEAFGATFEELAPALEYVSIEEIDALKKRCGIKGALLGLEWTDENTNVTLWEYV